MSTERLQQTVDQLHSILAQFSDRLQTIENKISVLNAELNKTEINQALLSKEIDFLVQNISGSDEKSSFSQETIARLDSKLRQFESKIERLGMMFEEVVLDEHNLKAEKANSALTNSVSVLKEKVESLSAGLAKERKYSFDRQQYYKKQIEELQQEKRLSEEDVKVMLKKFQESLLLKIEKKRLGERISSIFYLEHIPNQGKINQSSLKKQYRAGGSIYELRIDEVNSNQALLSLYLTEYAIQQAVKFQDLVIIPFFKFEESDDRLLNEDDPITNWRCEPATLKKVNSFWQVIEKGFLAKK